MFFFLLLFWHNSYFFCTGDKFDCCWSALEVYKKKKLINETATKWIESWSTTRCSLIFNSDFYKVGVVFVNEIFRVNESFVEMIYTFEPTASAVVCPVDTSLTLPSGGLLTCCETRGSNGFLYIQNKSGKGEFDDFFL